MLVHFENDPRRRAKNAAPLKSKQARPRQKTVSNAPGLPAPSPRHKCLVDSILANPDKAQYRHYQELYPKCKSSRVAANQASKILARPEVQDYMAAAQDRIAKQAQTTQDNVAARADQHRPFHESLMSSTGMPMVQIKGQSGRPVNRCPRSRRLLASTLPKTVPPGEWWTKRWLTRKIEVQMHDKLEAPEAVHSNVRFQFRAAAWTVVAVNNVHHPTRRRKPNSSSWPALRSTMLRLIRWGDRFTRTQAQP